MRVSVPLHTVSGPEFRYSVAERHVTRQVRGRFCKIHCVCRMYKVGNGPLHSTRLGSTHHHEGAVPEQPPKKAKDEGHTRKAAGNDVHDESAGESLLGDGLRRPEVGVVDSVGGAGTAAERGELWFPSRAASTVSMRTTTVLQPGSVIETNVLVLYEYSLCSRLPASRPCHLQVLGLGVARAKHAERGGRAGDGLTRVDHVDRVDDRHRERHQEDENEPDD